MNKLRHVALFTDDPQATAKFYQEVSTWRLLAPLVAESTSPTAISTSPSCPPTPVWLVLPVAWASTTSVSRWTTSKQQSRSCRESAQQSFPLTPPLMAPTTTTK